VEEEERSRLKGKEIQRRWKEENTTAAAREEAGEPVVLESDSGEEREGRG